MEIGKICDYLYDIGVLEMDSIDDFLKLNSNISLKKSNKNTDKLILTLSSYLSQKFNSKQSLNKLSENIINSFSEHVIINRYRGLKILYNILISKLRMKYISFFSKINIYIFDKFNNDINNKFEKKYNKRKFNERYIKDNNSNHINENINDNYLFYKSYNQKNYNQNLLLNYDYDIRQLSPERIEKIKEDNKKAEEFINNKNLFQDNYENLTSLNKNEDIEDEINDKNNIFYTNKNNIHKTNSCKHLKLVKDNFRYYNEINTEEFYEQEKNHMRRIEESRKRLEEQKEKEYALRCPFFPLINSYSKKICKRNYSNKKHQDKEGLNKVLKEFSPKKNVNNKNEVYYNSKEKERLKDIQEKNKKDKLEKEREKEEETKNIEMKRPKYCSKKTIERLAKPLRINKIEKDKDNNTNDNNNNIINIKLKKNKSKEKNKHGKIRKPKNKEKEIKQKEDKKGKVKKKEKKDEKKEEDKKEEVKKEEDKKEEEKKEEDKKDEGNSIRKSKENEVRDSQMSASIDIDKMIAQYSENPIGQLQQRGGFQSDALNNLINN